MKLACILRYHFRPKKYVIQFSPVRTGSTLIYNLLREILPGKTVVKVHTYSSHYRNVALVATYRHPLDCIASLIQVAGKKPDDDEVLKAADTYDKNGGNDILILKKHPHHLIFRYEIFVDDLTSVYDSIERYFDVIIKPNLREQLSHKYSIDEASKIAAKQESFTAWDPATKLHGNHISRFRGRPAYYNEFFSLKQIALLKSRYTKHLKTFGFE